MIQSIFEICEKEHPLPKNNFNNEININQTLNSVDISFISNNTSNVNNTIQELMTETNEKIENFTKDIENIKQWK